MATVSAAPAPGLQQIDLSKLNIQQLAQLKQQLDQVSFLNFQFCFTSVVALLSYSPSDEKRLWNLCVFMRSCAAFILSCRR